jgi:hypothetical protein
MATAFSALRTHRFVLAAALGSGLASGCTDAPANALPMAQAPPTATLVLATTGEATVGRDWGLQVTGANPGDMVTIVAGNGGLGNGACPPFLGGACVDFTGGSLGYRVILTGEADASGTWSTSLPFPGTVGNGTYQLQAFVEAGAQSNESNAVEVDVSRDCRVDAAEPNDALGAGPALGADGLVVCDTDDDWYSLTIPANAYTEITIDYAVTDGDLDAVLYDADGFELDLSGRATGTEILAYFNPGPAALDVWLRVYPFFDLDGNGIGYTVSTEDVFAGVCNDDAFEDDDEAGTARVVTPGVYAGQSCAADSDWFVVSVSAGELVRAEILEEVSAGDVDLNLYDGALVQQNIDAEDSIDWTSPIDQDVYIEVVLSSDSAFNDGNSYELDLVVATPGVCNDDAFEDDDLIGDARPVGAGTWTATSCPGDVDWFSIDLLAGDTLILDVDEDFTIGNVDFRVYDSPTNELTSGTTDDFVYDATTDITLFVAAELVSDDALNDGNEYDFVVDIIQLTQCPLDVYEPNDQRADAVTLAPGFFQGLGACESSDSDWYEISASPGDDIDVTIFFDDSDADVDLRITDANGNELARSESTSDDENVSITATATTYFIEVYVWADAGGPTSDGAVYDMEYVRR